MQLLSKILLTLIIYAISFNYGYAASSGSYLSAKIGDEKLSALISFKVIEQNTPAGTAIKYQFAGSKDNYTSWSDPQTTADVIDLTKISLLSQSKYLKVKISMNSDNNDLPTLKGFEVAYDTMGSQTTAAGSLANSAASSSTASQNSASSSASSSSSSAISSDNTNSPTVKTERVSLSQSQKKQILASAGSNIMLNIVIALVLTAIIGYVMFRNKQQEGL